MGYLHIDNLYKNQSMLLFKECYAMEKIHGTSAHISFKDGELSFFSGGAKHAEFIKLFNEPALKERFIEKQFDEIIIFGEAYGGSCQAMSHTYGKELKFVCFDIKIHDLWLNVINAEELANSLGFEFVHYKKVPCDIEHLDIERDSDSVQAIRNGMGEGHIREGIVIRPPIELRDNRWSRFIAKHKCAKFAETRTKREVSPDKLEILHKADDIALEWVTEQRLLHVIDKVLGEEKPTMQRTGDVIKAMVEDITREAKGEIVDSKIARNRISKRAACLFKKLVITS